MSTHVLSRHRSTSPLIYPRLRDRRIEVARGQGRKRLRRVVGLIGALALVVGAVALTRSPVLDVDRIMVRGTDGAAARAVRAASGVSPGDPLIAINTTSASAQIEALAWVEGASVSRSWPSTVVVTITERVPVAAVGDGRSLLAVDGAGRALGPAAGRAALPVIAGPVVVEGASLSAPRRQVAGIIGGLPPALRREVALAKATDRGVVLELTDGIRIRWGDGSQQSAKADALRVLLEQDDRATFRTIDVSVPRATTVSSDAGGS